MSKHLVLRFHQIEKTVRMPIDNTDADKFVSIHSSDTLEVLKNKTLTDPSNLVSAKMVSDGINNFDIPPCPGIGHYLETACAADLPPGTAHTNNIGFVWRKSNNSSMHHITKSIEVSEKNVNMRLEALSKRIDDLEKENDKLTADLMKTNSLLSELDSAIGNIGRVDDDESTSGTSIRTKTAKSILEAARPVLNEEGEIVVAGSIANIVASLIKMQFESKKE